MLRIPYVPRPYQDETLGSLPTRLLLYNGAGLWRSLLEESGSRISQEISKMTSAATGSCREGAA
jgi:hypothetical protein